ncbi:hypothetical protein EDB92DRAFT_1877438 [Lactarius akahatsu]|uniref:Uncharacterized protein n=1 Tax=Lactarius akahatsu TaxID=416441 RepID=A0AAD4Q8M2_9AGAM|nr:hypothetical protein EDB92DRAFT_1877438 [Lactarius akahatsu]
MATWILEPIRHIYVSLHQDTNSVSTRFSASTHSLDVILVEPSSFSVCNVVSHIHNNSAPTSFAPTIQHDNAAQVSSIAGPDVPSLSVPSPLHVVESLASEPPLDNFHPAHQKPVEDLRPSATSPDAATAGTVRNIITLGTAIPQFTLESSISDPSLSPTSLPAAVALRQNAEPLKPSNPSNLPSPASSNQILSIRPTGAPGRCFDSCQ